MRALQKMDPYEVYQKYLALKRHFDSDTYDYFKYHGKIKTSKTSFDVRKDKYSFYKLSRMKYPESFMVANIIDNDHFWSGDFTSAEAESTFKKWQSRKESLTYNFKQAIAAMMDDYDKNIIFETGDHPRLLVLFIRKVVSPETLLILNKLTSFFPYWDKKMVDDLYWPEQSKKLKKYEPFIINTVDLDKFSSIMKSRFNKP